MCVSVQSAGDGGGVDGGGVDGGGVEGGGMERDKEWEEYTREREKRLRLMEELWEDEDTRKRKRKLVEFIVASLISATHVLV